MVASQEVLWGSSSSSLGQQQGSGNMKFKNAVLSGGGGMRGKRRMNWGDRPVVGEGEEEDNDGKVAVQLSGDYEK